MPEPWRVRIRSYLNVAHKPVHLVGIGNPLRRDDGVGLTVASHLRARLRGANSGLMVHENRGSPETFLSRLPAGEGLVIFDSVEAGLKPGSVVCATLRDTDYGFFATHNVPLRLIPGIAQRTGDILMVGIEPESLEVGEGLTHCVDASARAVISEILAQVEVRE